jgi:hypothetical protein
MDDCREELHALLQEQVCFGLCALTLLLIHYLITQYVASTDSKRLAGASLLVFANKQDITGSMSDAEIKSVSAFIIIILPLRASLFTIATAVFVSLLFFSY